MKNIKTDFEDRFWTTGKGFGLQLMEHFFQFNELDVSKERLSNMMKYAVKRNGWIHEDPAVIFQFHQSMRLLVRAGHLVMQKERKWTVDTRPEKIAPSVLGLLSEKEYRNPLLVFRKAFWEYDIKEFDYFMSGIVYFSMGAYENLPESNIVMPYIHTVKMLDAGYLILQRKKEKEKAENNSGQEG
ncbi:MULTISPECIES: hypothetical protein [Chryseobacterium]|uniref:Uncharacterized protein n=1 Tax=Chryseobacterium camelliae TaxID=1265445 RepID=A0ABU0THW7_9FLAO|nr:MULTISPECIES: hypothetical protein [Chryseobacterium]MDT3409492.1 hypothetical protein [Pseudacidovorax intermedius]MDQ1096643.1 hypothetical protein [Chryseobacterium camelliae]MDQ1100585.1 hypothetical protein [Chryseobacterium sp. SORGH_AS_1048]MDR6087925.1 hypothetical protein [Chryseobacterium sp. SORGH_AS_0909]MDR6132299.1 hypothetical protein [Chryseobacterium sp. SORGH_AS_1175]